MSLDAEFAKRSEMRIYTHFTIPAVYTGTSRVSFADSSKAIDKKKSAIFIADFNKWLLYGTLYSLHISFYCL